MKTLVMISNLNQINLNCDGIIIGIKGLSVNMPNYFNLDDLKDIDKEIFVSLNKNMHNCDLKNLEETLIKLNNYNIKGVIFYDMAILNMAKRLKLNYELIWNQCHMTTNYHTINVLSKYTNGTWVSNDITLREMNEIKNNTNTQLMITLFGYLPMFVSKRNLVKNYKKTFDIKDESEINYIYKEEKKYPLVDNELGTMVYTNFILNGLEEKLLLDFDYIVLNSFLIDDDKFSKVLELFNNVNKENVKKYEKILSDMFNNLGKGFFYQETIYKVK